MTDDEESLMWLGVRLAKGIQDMLDGDRLRLSDIPDDDQWLIKMLSEMKALHESVKAADDR